MPGEVLQDIGWAVVFSVVGAVVGLLLVMAAAVVLPWFVNRLTPNLDEAKEIARGNEAVAQYFGRVVGAGIIGVSIIIAAAVLGGIIAALY